MRPENQNLVESFNEAKLVEATENLNIHKSQIIYRSATKKICRPAEGVTKYSEHDRWKDRF